MSSLPDAAVVRERGAAARAASGRLSSAFRASQTGAVRRALVVDDGSSAVTDNYLRVRLDRPCVRNEWIEVEVLDANAGRVLTAESA
jgi:hypothetical protein